MNDRDSINRELTALLHTRRSSLIADVEVLRGFVTNTIPRATARDSAHRLAGTLGLFGLGSLGSDAREIEDELASPSSELASESLLVRIEGFSTRATRELFTD